jgi:hypothetical protein
VVATACVLVVSIGACAVTVIVVEVCPTLIVISTVAVCEARIVTDPTRVFSKPDFSASTVYCPGTRDVTLYKPASVVEVCTVTPVSKFFTLTVTSETTAPLVSVTAPVKEP